VVASGTSASATPGPRDQRADRRDALQYRPERRAIPQTVIGDDREQIEEGDRTVLVIETIRILRKSCSTWRE